MCVLRVAVYRKTLADFLSGTLLPVYESHDKTTPQRFGPDKGKAYGYAGFQSAVSQKEWDDLPGQVANAIRFLRRYRDDLKRLRDDFKVHDIILDFPYYFRIGKNDVAVQWDFLPPALISIAGGLGIGIEMTLYPHCGPARRRKRNVERAAAPSARPAPVAGSPTRGKGG
jgi:hypothetical protein